jgi:hypothetical protein
MKFPLITVLVVTNEPKKWAHEVLKNLNQKYVVSKHYRHSAFSYNIYTPMFCFMITRDAKHFTRGYRFSFVIYDKLVDKDIRNHLQIETNDIYTNRCWIDLENEEDCPTANLHWYQKLWSRIKKIFIKHD